MNGTPAPTRRRWVTGLGISVGLLLSACNNTYGPPPPDGKPRNYGQERYLENQHYQQMIDQGQSN